MGLTLQQKQETVTQVSAQLAKAQAVIVAEYRGLGVGAMTGLRAKARGAREQRHVYGKPPRSCTRRHDRAFERRLS